MTLDPQDHRTIRVMQSFRRPRATTNPYIHMLDDALAGTEGLAHLRFSWPTALISRYDVLHFHWPEAFLGGRTPVRRLIRRARFQALLLRLRLTRTPIVRTVHNLELPTGLPRWERRMLEEVRDRAHVDIALNAQTAVRDRPTIVIPHGHYIDWFADAPRVEPVAGRVGFVGLVRRYKGVESLIAAYDSLRKRREGVSLSISGNPTSEEIRDEIRGSVEGLPDVSLQLAYISEDDYAAAVGACELVVLPYIHMHNSGSVLAALSLDRAVLVPANDVNRALIEEVGEGWIHLFEGSLDADDLERALDAAAPTASAPNLSLRDWAHVGAAHRDAYRAARGTR